MKEKHKLSFMQRMNLITVLYPFHTILFFSY